MKKIVHIGYAFNAPKKFKKLCNDREPTIVFDDQSTRTPEIYEYHGSFKLNDTWIMYGHENIIVLDAFGKEIHNEHTR